MKRPALIALVATTAVVTASAGYRFFWIDGPPNSTGKLIAPIQAGVPVGSFPVQMKLSPDGKWLVVTNSGFRQQLSVIDTSWGSVASALDFNKTVSGSQQETLYWGLDFVGKDLYVSRGSQESVSVYALGDDGKLTFSRNIENRSKQDQKLENLVGGIACDGTTLYAVINESGVETDWRGFVSEIDVATGKERGKIVVGGFPLGIAVAKDRHGETGSVYVTSEQDGVVNYFRPQSRVAESIRTGTNPTAIVAAGGRVFVSNSGSDTVSIIDTETNKVVKTIVLRPPQLRSLPSCTPLGLTMSPDGSTLYVALADLNAVAVVDVPKGSVKGYLPTGWYPTDVKLSPDGKRLFVSNGKGVQTRIPNGKAIGKLGTYIQDIIEGTVSMIPLEEAGRRLDSWTAAVLHNNRVDRPAKTIRNPGIKHVIYVIKENRTYDNVLGDLPQGNGDASLCLFPREVTPNQHALADRFVLLDNFFCCAEVSGDGWNWSTAGAASEYVSRNVPYMYSGRGRNYDFEGQVNDARPEFHGVRDVAAPPGGYLWDNCAKKRLSFRNYGFFTGVDNALGVKEGQDPENLPSKKALDGKTDPDFRQYDLLYPDSDLTHEYGIDVPHQLAAYGRYKSRSRFAEWKREFDECVKKGNLPAFQMIRFCRDHTSGTAAGRLSPRAMVADNDYAVGQLVEAVSKSKYWKDTVICVVEDDAQSGLDHVDCHRSTAYLISPYIPKATKDSRFYNTDGMIRTMELFLGMQPMNGFDAVADPIDVFGKEATNIEPYTAIKPSVDIAGEMNKKTSYRAADSARLINRFREESMPDIELNDILWHSIKGKTGPVRTAVVRDDDD